MLSDFYDSILISTLWNSIKILINRNLNEIELGDQNGGSLLPCANSRIQQEEERLFFFSGKDSANWKAVNSLFTLVLPISFPPPLYTQCSSFPCRDLHVAPHGCRPQTTILWWSEQIRLSWRNIWQSIFFRSTIGSIIISISQKLRPTKMKLSPHGLHWQGWNGKLCN